jgi:hypothetical protein
MLSITTRVSHSSLLLLLVEDPRPHITAMPQAFHQRVNHDKSSYNPRDVHLLLLAAMVGLTTAITAEAFVCPGGQRAIKV